MGLERDYAAMLEAEGQRSEDQEDDRVDDLEPANTAQIDSPHRPSQMPERASQNR